MTNNQLIREYDHFDYNSEFIPNYNIFNVNVNGFIGIGTHTPKHHLSVTNNLNIKGNLIVTGNLLYNNNSSVVYNNNFIHLLYKNKSNNIKIGRLIYSSPDSKYSDYNFYKKDDCLYINTNDDRPTTILTYKSNLYNFTTITSNTITIDLLVSDVIFITHIYIYEKNNSLSNIVDNLGSLLINSINTTYINDSYKLDQSIKLTPYIKNTLVLNNIFKSSNTSELFIQFIGNYNFTAGSLWFNTNANIHTLQNVSILSNSNYNNQLYVNGSSIINNNLIRNILKTNIYNNSGNLDINGILNTTHINSDKLIIDTGKITLGNTSSEHFATLGSVNSITKEGDFTCENSNINSNINLQNIVTNHSKIVLSNNINLHDFININNTSTQFYYNTVISNKLNYLTHDLNENALLVDGNTNITHNLNTKYLDYNKFELNDNYINSNINSLYVSGLTHTGSFTKVNNILTETFISPNINLLPSIQKTNKPGTIYYDNNTNEFKGHIENDVITFNTNTTNIDYSNFEISTDELTLEIKNFSNDFLTTTDLNTTHLNSDKTLSNTFKIPLYDLASNDYVYNDLIGTINFNVNADDKFNVYDGEKWNMLAYQNTFKDPSQKYSIIPNINFIKSTEQFIPIIPQNLKYNITQSNGSYFNSDASDNNRMNIISKNIYKLNLDENFGISINNNVIGIGTNYYIANNINIIDSSLNIYETTLTHESEYESTEYEFVHINQITNTTSPDLYDNSGLKEYFNEQKDKSFNIINNKVYIQNIHGSNDTNIKLKQITLIGDNIYSAYAYYSLDLGNDLIPIISIKTPITIITLSNDNTPTITIVSNKSGILNTTFSSTINTNNISITQIEYTITFDNLDDGVYSNITITLTDDIGNYSNILTIPSFTIDTVSPVITEMTIIPIFNSNNTPSYEFNSTKSGTILTTITSSSNSVDLTISSSTTINTGSNTIVFNTISDGTYSNYTIMITDEVGNNSNILTIPTFTIDSNAPITGDVSLGYKYIHSPSVGTYNTDSTTIIDLGTAIFDAYLRYDLKIGWTNMDNHENETNGITPYKWTITSINTFNEYSISNKDKNLNTNTYTFKIIYQLTDNDTKYYLIVNNDNNKIIKPNFSINDWYIGYGFKQDILANEDNLESSDYTSTYNSSSTYTKNDCWIIESFSDFPIPSSYRDTLNTDYELIYPKFLMSSNKQYTVYMQRDGAIVFSRTYSAPARTNTNWEPYYIAHTSTYYSGYSLYIKSGYLHVNHRNNKELSINKSTVGNINYMKVENNGIFAGYDTNDNLVYTFGDVSVDNNTNQLGLRPKFTQNTEVYIGFTHSSSITNYDTYDVHFYLNDIGSNVFKWGHLNLGSLSVGDIDNNYKFNLSHTTGNTFTLTPNSSGTNLTYDIIHQSSNKYFIKRSNGDYLKHPTYDHYQLLQLNTIGMIKDNHKINFLNLVWESSSSMIASPHPNEYLFEIDLFTNIKIPPFLGNSLSNNVNGVATDTYLLYPQYLRSNNGNYVLMIERNGNLIIFSSTSSSGNGLHMWDSQSYSNGNGLVIQGTDGNLIVYSDGVRYDKTGTAKWNGETHYTAHYNGSGLFRTIYITNNGQFEIYDGNNNFLKRFP